MHRANVERGIPERLQPQPLRIPHEPVRAERPGPGEGNRAPYAYEHEDQSATGLRIGMRVRHPLFGVGSVIAVEEHNDDLKVAVRFNTVGVKKLLSKYAKLEPA